jgi:hydroxypyruvate reductase
MAAASTEYLARAGCGNACSQQDPAGFLRHLYDVAVRNAASRVWRVICPSRPRAARWCWAPAAGGSLAQALEALWPQDAPLSGLVVTRYAHIPPRPEDGPAPGSGGNRPPVPDAAGLAAAERILALTGGLTADDLVICLISGGGSSLLTLPAEGIDLAEKQRISKALLEAARRLR